MDFFDVNAIATTVFEYKLSYLELIGTISGLVCVWLATKQSILTWPIGLINVICLFIIFYQINLYADMFLQVYFFLVAIYGWFTWTYHKRESTEVRKSSHKSILIIVVFILLLSTLMGYFMKNIHLTLPDYFLQAASFPYLDSFIAVASIFANIMMARRIIENWVLWIIIDVVAVYVYMQKGILFISILYGVYCFIAWNGYLAWKKIKYVK